jgi:hypothetical protein
VISAVQHLSRQRSVMGMCWPRAQRKVQPVAVTSPWSGALVDAEAHRQIVLEIERNKDAISAHEQVCEQRYGRIDQALADQAGDITEIKDALKIAINRGAAAAWGANWKAMGLLVFVIVTLLGALSWTAGQLYALEPGRIAAENAKK